METKTKYGCLILISIVLLASVALALPAPTTTITNSPKNNQNIVCRVTSDPFDPSDSTVEYTFEWTVNGSSHSTDGPKSQDQSTISSSLTSKGDTWGCSAMAENSTETADWSTEITTTVANSNPSPDPILAGEPTSIPDVYTTTYICRVSNYDSISDDDDDPITYDFTWEYKPSAGLWGSVPGAMGSDNPSGPDGSALLLNAPASVGDRFRCSVTMTDGTYISPSYTHTFSTVVAVFIPIPTLNSVSLGPITAGGEIILDSDLTATVDASGVLKDETGTYLVDEEGTQLELEFRWYQGASLFDTNVITSNKLSDSIDSSNTDSGEIWTVRVYLKRGSEYSGYVSDSAVVQADPTTIVLPSTNPFSTSPDGTYVTYAGVADRGYWDTRRTGEYCTWDYVRDNDPHCTEGDCGTHITYKDSCTGDEVCTNADPGAGRGYWETEKYWVPRWEYYFDCHYISGVTDWTTCYNHETFANAYSWSTTRTSRIDNPNAPSAWCSHTATLYRNCNIPPRQPTLEVTPNTFEIDTLNTITCKITGLEGTYKAPMFSGDTTGQQPASYGGSNWAFDGSIPVWSASWTGSDWSPASLPSPRPTAPDPDLFGDADTTNSQNIEPVHYRFDWFRTRSGSTSKIQTHTSASSTIDYSIPANQALAPFSKLEPVNATGTKITLAGDVISCVITPVDFLGLEGLSATSSAITIEPPDGGFCDGEDSDFDGLIDEGMYSCLNGEYFTSGGSRYCFVCSLDGVDLSSP